MNGVHDMGGMHGFGPVEPERDEPVFHYDWEKKVFALRFASGAMGKWNIDMARHANERMPPADYLAATYYERWLNGLERLLLEGGVVTQRELESGRSIDVTEGKLVDEGPTRTLEGNALLTDDAAAAGKPVRFRVTLGGVPPKMDAGMDVDADGNGVVREHRLYQLVREKGPVSEQEFVIEFLDPGVDAYSFTFG